MKSPVSLDSLTAAIRESWSAETAHAPRAWSSAAPSAGQCWMRDQFPTGQEFRECEVPEATILSVSGPRANLLLERVQRRLDSGAGMVEVPGA